MGKDDFSRFFEHKHYTFRELVGQAMTVYERYAEVSFITKIRGIEMYILLRPTENSVSYKLKLVADVDSTIVSIFPVDPYIGRWENGLEVPHTYQNGAMCLYFPDNNEWKYTDLWADTLIPWASLWLYYYELWEQTGEWLGGGKHGNGA